MISGAARVAPEKAVFRPALPMSFTPGISEMQMSNNHPLGQFKDEDGVQWDARLTLEGEHPTIVMRRADLERIDRYRLAQFLRPEPRADRFCIAGMEPGDQDYWLPAQEVQRLATAACGSLPATAGHFEIRWVPNDPAMPF